MSEPFAATQLVEAAGLTQPYATVIASLLALVAAGIAYAGVMRTTRTTREQGERKERFDRGEALRKERTEVLIEAIAAARRATRLLIRLDRATEAEARAQFVAVNVGEHEDAQSAASLSVAKLMLYGFEDITEPMSRQLVDCGEQWRKVAADPTHPIDVAALTEHLRATLAAFRSAFTTLGQPPTHVV